MTTFEIVRDVVLLALGLFGAGLSIFNYFEAAKRDKRNVRVELSSAIPTYGATLGQTFAKVEVTNIGQRPVVVSTLNLQLPDGRTLVSLTNRNFPGIDDTVLPALLTDGQSAHRFYSYADIAHALVSAGFSKTTEIIPVCLDSSGGKHKGKSWQVDPAELSRL